MSRHGGRHLALLVALAAAACVRAEPPESAGMSADAAPLDTLRGTVAIVGADPETMVALRVVQDDGTARSVLVAGSAAATLRRVEGAEVLLSGRAAGDAPPRFDARRLVVASVNGQPARDGVLEADGSRLVLRLTTGGRSTIVQPPAALRALVGARVWITGPADAAPVSYGVIESPDA